MVLEFAREHAVCRRLMTVPGVGAVVGLTFIAAIEDLARFVKSRSVGAILGMVPRKHQSGEVDRNGRITKTGDTEARAALFEAAHVMLHRVKKWSGLKAWATKVAQRQGNKRATVALARKMAVVMHRMWGDRTTFRFGAVEAPATTAASSSNNLQGSRPGAPGLEGSSSRGRARGEAGMTGVLAPGPSPLSHRLASHRNAIMWRSSCRPRTEAKSPVGTR